MLIKNEAVRRWHSRSRHTVGMEFGLGLIGIGRRWGHAASAVPGEAAALAFLEAAWSAGVRYWDTAPSYGSSEPRTGQFLRTLTPAERNELRLATKFGEHWDEARGEPYEDHSFEALRRSLDQSLQRLGRIDVLQVHKTTPAALASDGLQRALEYARSLGITVFGASVKDEPSGQAAIACGHYRMLQLPLHREATQMLPLARHACMAGLWVAVNRPLAMGRLAADRTGCFRYLRNLDLQGVILCGTKNSAHLRENLADFAAA